MRIRREKIVKSRAQWRKEDQVHRIRTFMTVVVVSLCFSLAAAAFFVWNEVRGRAALQAKNSGPASSAAVSEGEEPLPEYDDVYNLTLVNSNVPLGKDFSANLVSEGGVKVDSRIVPALEKMMEAAKADGCALKLAGGYVSAGEQDRLFQAEVQRLVKSKGETQVRAENEAMKSVGRGGYNENQTGMAVVFSAEGMKSGQSFSSPAQYNWLVKHCVDYGFTLRYPKDKDAVTGMSFNPAHFRYVGKDNAVSMRELSMCLEEYVSYLGQQKGS